MIFSRISPKLPEKFFVQLLPTKFLPQRSLKTFFGVTSKKGLHVFFCKPWAPFFEVKQLLAAFLPRILANQTFGGALAPTAPPPQTQLLFITVS